MPSWEDIRYFLALAEAGSLAGAGRSLGVQHTTVARRVSQLETDLGVALVTRSPDGVRLTDAGERALQHARTAARELETMARAVEGDDERIEGTVRLTVSQAFSGFLVRRLADLRGSYPDLDIHLLTDNRTYDLSRGEADIALRMSVTEDPDLKIRKLVDVGWAVYASKTYLDAHPRPVTIKDLRDHAMIGFGQSMQSIDGAEWLRSADLECQVVLHVNSIPAALNAALAGIGIVPLPCFMTAEESLLVRLFDEVVSTRTAYLVTQPDLARTQRVRVVVDHLLAIVERERDLLEGTVRTRP